MNINTIYVQNKDGDRIYNYPCILNTTIYSSDSWERMDILCWQINIYIEIESKSRKFNTYYSNLRLIVGLIRYWYRRSKWRQHSIYHNITTIVFILFAGILCYFLIPLCWVDDYLCCLFFVPIRLRTSKDSNKEGMIKNQTQWLSIWNLITLRWSI